MFRPAESVLEGGTPAAPDTLWRRYSEFELLRTYLLVTYPYIIVPPLPEKRVRSAHMEGKTLIYFICRSFCWLIWLEFFCNHLLLSLHNRCCASCRQSLCGTNCLRTTSTQTLLSGGESAWKTSYCALHHTLSSPMIKSSSSFWQRWALRIIPHNGLIQVKSRPFGGFCRFYLLLSVRNLLWGTLPPHKFPLWVWEDSIPPWGQMLTHPCWALSNTHSNSQQMAAGSLDQKIWMYLFPHRKHLYQQDLPSFICITSFYLSADASLSLTPMQLWPSGLIVLYNLYQILCYTL